MVTETIGGADISATIFDKWKTAMPFYGGYEIDDRIETILQKKQIVTKKSFKRRKSGDPELLLVNNIPTRLKRFISANRARHSGLKLLTFSLKKLFSSGRFVFLEQYGSIAKQTPITCLVNTDKHRKSVELRFESQTELSLYTKQIILEQIRIFMKENDVDYQFSTCFRKIN